MYLNIQRYESGWRVFKISQVQLRYDTERLHPVFYDEMFSGNPNILWANCSMWSNGYSYLYL